MLEANIPRKAAWSSANRSSDIGGEGFLLAMKHVIPIKGIVEGFRNPNQQRENLKKKSVLRIILYQDFHAHLVCHRFSPIFQREIHLLHPEIVGLRLRQGQAVRNLSPTIRQN